MKPFAYARPQAVTEALELARGGATVMAGGTDLLGLMKDGIAAPERIVDIRGLEPLRGWARTKGKGLRIGALVPLAELETSVELAKLLPIVGEALRPAATLQLDPHLLGRFPEGYRHLAYLQSNIGYTIKPDMPGLKGAEVEALYARGRQWLAGQPL